ncbi:MAG: cytochrome c biogenesis protein ResB [Acidobacteriota bacterium]|nr:cytochrome c biogenesis protein ResB [Acidobacteriota bacterium]MDQ5835551.1 cytochrome c biogenesis protein ResB [Acidobacteriota bacterium]
MSAIRETQTTTRVMSKPAAQSPVYIAERPGVGARAMDLLSSVRFGVVLLVLLALACMVGMLIVQVNVDGFEKFYAEMTPSQRLLYGSLGFFDIYHTWYFNAMLLVLSLNIILSSIDFFPKAWTYISRRKLDASAHWLRGQDQHAQLMLAGDDEQEVASRLSAACRSLKLKATVTEKGGACVVFGERGAWNRLGAYAVHVALLTIFVGGFLTARFGHTGQMAVRPGETSAEMTEQVFLDMDKPSQVTFDLPFTVECTDIQQKLLEKNGPISPMNTLDWLTRVRIKDPARGETEALIQMNRPFDYHGYRFFQSSFAPEGKARQITLKVTPEQGGDAQELTIRRDGSATLADGTRVQFKDFFSDFILDGGRPDTQSQDYNNPAAVMKVVRTDGQVAQAYAFQAGRADSAPVAGRAVAGYKFQLADFERVGEAHILSVQKDPGASVVYAGFILLALTLAAVFLFAHQRVWARIEPRGAGEFEVIIGGNTNRNKLGFEDRFRKLVKAVEEGASIQ